MPNSSICCFEWTKFCCVTYVNIFFQFGWNQHRFPKTTWLCVEKSQLNWLANKFSSNIAYRQLGVYLYWKDISQNGHYKTHLNRITILSSFIATIKSKNGWRPAFRAGEQSITCEDLIDTHLFIEGMNLIIIMNLPYTIAFCYVR